MTDGAEKSAGRRRRTQTSKQIAEPVEVVLTETTPVEGPPARPNWAASDSSANAQIGWDFREQWSVPGVPTGYLRASGDKKRKVIARLRDQDGKNWPIQPLTKYSFSMLAAAHRCAGRVRLTVLDDAGAELLVLVDVIDVRCKGGVHRSAYHRSRIEFVSPPGATRLRIEAIQDPLEGAGKAADRFLFLVEPRLEPSTDPVGPRGLQWAVHEQNLFLACEPLPDESLTLMLDRTRHRLKSADGPIYLAQTIPLGLLDGRPHDVSIWSGDTEVWCDWILVPTPTDGGYWAQKLADAGKALDRVRGDVKALQARLDKVGPVARELVRLINGEKAEAAPAKAKAPELAPAASGEKAVASAPIALAPAVSEIGPGAKGDPRLPLVNWVIGPPDNISWAYGNNAKRIASRLKAWRHEISGDTPADVVLYFDALVAERFGKTGQASVLRVGGDRPLDRRFGDDKDKLREGLAEFDTVITLSPSIQRRVSACHPNSVFIPNGLDLRAWRPEALVPDTDRPFTVGFAASVKSPLEREVKGLNLAVAAAQMCDAPMVRAHKGSGQIGHGDMVTQFYSKIDVLVHPVAPGREGTSNVIMEAISLGVPVILTRDAGFHGEVMADGREVLVVSRDVEEIARAIARVRDDVDLRRQLSAGGRAFAEANHDLDLIAAQYEDLLRQTVIRTRQGHRPDVSFHPFWKPVDDFASSRLRGRLPVELLQRQPLPSVTSLEPAAPSAETAVVVQCAEDGLMEQLNASASTAVVYDVCDRYFENERLFKTPTGEVSSLTRFHDLAERADVIIAPTLHLKGEIAARLPDKPVYFVPEMRDYDTAPADATPAGRNLLWFGSPQRGNFESAQWVIDHLVAADGYTLKLVSKAKFFRNMPAYKDLAVDWSPEVLGQALAEASLCIVAHSPEEFSKSPNRLVTAVCAGVPTLVSESPAAEALLREAGCDFAIVRTPEDVEAAARRLDEPEARREYIRRVQSVIEKRHGDRAVRQSYLDVFTKRLAAPKGERPLRVAFITHNLNIGEGAPTSLFELSTGLRDRGLVEPFVYCTSGGPLKDIYAAANVPVEIFEDEGRAPMRVLNQRFDKVKRAFQKWLKDNEVDFVVANTIKSSPFVKFAQDVDVRAALIIRESFAAPRRFDYFSDEAAKVARKGLVQAQNVVFVSDHTVELWRDEPKAPDLRVIKNGVSRRRFDQWFAMSRDEARAAVGVETDLTAICVGTINTRKGQLQLARWYAELGADIRERLTILFVGATESAHLESFRAELAAMPEETAARLKIIPATSDVGLYYRASDIFLMNSAEESYPRSTMEALAFGMPIVSTPVFGVKEQVEHGVNGLLYPFGDGPRWREQITQLVVDEAFRTRMSEVAARSFYTLTTHAEMLHDYYSLMAPRYPLDGSGPRLAASAPVETPVEPVVTPPDAEIEVEAAPKTRGRGSRTSKTAAPAAS